MDTGQAVGVNMMKSSIRKIEIRTAREIEKRMATREEQELLRQFFQLTGESQEDVAGAVSVLLQLFPDIGAYAARKYLHETQLQPETIADMFMDIEDPDERRRFLASCQELTDEERQKMAQYYPYQPLSPEQRLYRKRICIGKKQYAQCKSPCLSEFYSEEDLAGLCGRQAAVIRFLQSSPVLERDEAEDIADIVLEKSVREMRVSIYDLLYRMGDNFIYDKPGDSKRRRLAVAKGRPQIEPYHIGDGIITQEEIDELLNAGIHLQGDRTFDDDQGVAQTVQAVDEPDVQKFATAYFFRDVPFEASEFEVCSHIMQELGKAVDALYEAKALWAKAVHSYKLAFSEDFVDKVGAFDKILYMQEPAFDKVRLLSSVASVSEAKEKICKYRLLRRLWQQRLSPAHEVSRDLLQRVRTCQDFASFANMTFSPMEATQLLGLVLEDEIVVPQCYHTLWHSLAVSQAIFDAASMFKASYTHNVRFGAISAVTAADTRDFPKQTSLLDVVSVLDRVLARRIELNEAEGLHKPLIEHREMQTKALDDEEAKEKNSGIWPRIRQWLTN